jgi:hypothetical protein
VAGARDWASLRNAAPPPNRSLSAILYSNRVIRPTAP